jgi:hypothetical protein
MKGMAGVIGSGDQLGDKAVCTGWMWAEGGGISSSNGSGAL